MEYFNYTLSFSSPIVNGFSVKVQKKVRIQRSAYEYSRMRFWNKLASNYSESKCFAFSWKYLFCFQINKKKLIPWIYIYILTIHNIKLHPYFLFTPYIWFMLSENGNFLLSNVLKNFNENHAIFSVCQNWNHSLWLTQITLRMTFGNVLDFVWWYSQKQLELCFRFTFHSLNINKQKGNEEFNVLFLNVLQKSVQWFSLCKNHEVDNSI